TLSIGAGMLAEYVKDTGPMGRRIYAPAPGDGVTLQLVGEPGLPQHVVLGLVVAELVELVDHVSRLGAQADTAQHVANARAEVGREFGEGAVGGLVADAHGPEADQRVRQHFCARQLLLLPHAIRDQRRLLDLLRAGAAGPTIEIVLRKIRVPAQAEAWRQPVAERGGGGPAAFPIRSGCEIATRGAAAEVGAQRHPLGLEWRGDEYSEQDKAGRHGSS